MDGIMEDITYHINEGILKTKKLISKIYFEVENMDGEVRFSEFANRKSRALLCLKDTLYSLESAKEDIGYAIFESEG